MSVDNQDYIISINNTASIIKSKLDSEVVEFIFQKYGAHDTDDLSPAYLPDVFNELHSIETDLR